MGTTGILKLVSTYSFLTTEVGHPADDDWALRSKWRFTGVSHLASVASCWIRTPAHRGWLRAAVAGGPRSGDHTLLAKAVGRLTSPWHWFSVLGVRNFPAMHL